MLAWNLGLRFLLEIAGVFALGVWGLHLADSWARYALMPVLPAIAMTLWGTFNVKGDPSRSGKAPVPVPGLVRLLVELIVFGAGVTAFAQVWGPISAAIYAGAIVIHYATAWKRVAWLLAR